MWPLHETCVENFLFSGVLCPCRAMCAVQCALHIRNTAHGTCFMSSPVLCLYCHVLCTYKHMTARLCPFGCRVFLGEYSFGRFPICSQERRHSVWGWSVHTQFIPAVQCSMSLLPRQRRRRGISSATGQLPPPLWLAGSGQTLDSGSPLHGGTTNNQHLNAHTLLSSGDPDQ